MKKLLALSLAALAVLTFSACAVQLSGDPASTDDVTLDPNDPNSVFTECNETVYATDKVNIRTSPDTSSSANIVDQLPKGGSITRTGYNDSWGRVEYNGMTCYIASQYLSLTDQGGTDNPGSSSSSIKFTDVDETIYMVDDTLESGLAVRSAPNTGDSDNVVFYAKYGESYKRTGVYLDGNEIDGIPTGWSRIEYTEDGTTKIGYTRSWHWSTEAPADAE